MTDRAVPPVAPANGCVSCFRPGTTTMVVFRGEPEWIVGGLVNVAGLPGDRAVQTFTVLAAEELDAAPGTVPQGVVTLPVRLCASCADRNGVPAPALSLEGDVRAGGTVPSYKQPGIPA